MVKNGDMFTIYALKAKIYIFSNFTNYRLSNGQESRVSTLYQVLKARLSFNDATKLH